MKKPKPKSKRLSKILKPTAVIIISILTIFTIVKAGNLTPPTGEPTAQFYTLTEIYEFITNNEVATEGGHGFTFAGALSSTHHTLTEIYDALTSLISADQVKLGTTYLGTAGTLTPDGGTAGVGDIFNGKTAHLTGDWTLDTGTLDLACNTTTFDASANLVETAYDGDGDGSNRWCMTDSGTVSANEMKTGQIAWVDGQAVTGTGTQTLLATSETVAAGYYEATTLSVVDSDLAAGNILSGKTIFGIAGSASSGYTYGDNNAAYVLVSATGAGTALKDLFNGTGQGVDGGSQANGGVDDYNNGDSAPSDRYTKGWTQCNAGNNYCGTGDSGADAKDDSTGLIWSLPCNGAGCSSFSDSSPLEYSWDNSDSNNNSRTASQLCSDHSGWSLPHQKQLMQAYIDGAYDNLDSSGVGYWSGTTVSNFSLGAWVAYLAVGYTHANSKATTSYVRCVRPAS